MEQSGTGSQGIYAQANLLRAGTVQSVQPPPVPWRGATPGLARELQKALTVVPWLEAQPKAPVQSHVGEVEPGRGHQ